MFGLNGWNFFKVLLVHESQQEKFFDLIFFVFLIVLLYFGNTFMSQHEPSKLHFYNYVSQYSHHLLTSRRWCDHSNNFIFVKQLQKYSFKKYSFYTQIIRYFFNSFSQSIRRRSSTTKFQDFLDVVLRPDW